MKYTLATVFTAFTVLPATYHIQDGHHYTDDVATIKHTNDQTHLLISDNKGKERARTSLTLEDGQYTGSITVNGINFSVSAAPECSGEVIFKQDTPNSILSRNIFKNTYVHVPCAPQT